MIAMCEKVSTQCDLERRTTTRSGCITMLSVDLRSRGLLVKCSASQPVHGARHCFCAWHELRRVVRTRAVCSVPACEARLRKCASDLFRRADVPARAVRCEQRLARRTAVRQGHARSTASPNALRGARWQPAPCR